MKKSIWGLIILVILPGLLSADPLVLSIDKAVKLALENNLGLKNSKIDVEIKKRASDLSWNRFIPTVQASGTLMRWNTQQSGSITKGITEAIPGTGIYDTVAFGSYDLPRWGLSAGLDFSLNLSYALFKEIEGTKVDYSAGLISYETALKKLERDVRKNFYNILVFKENLKLMEQNLQAAGERYEQAKINYSNGLVPELSKLSAQVGYENLKPALSEMELGYVNMLDGFKMLLGIDIAKDIDIEGTISINPVKLNTEKLTEKFLPGRLDMQKMENSIQSLKIQRSALKLRSMTPMLVLGWNMDPAYSLDPWANNWFENMKDNWSQKSGMFRLTIAMSLDSLLPWSAAQAGIKDMGDGIRQLEIGISQTRTAAEMEIKSLVMQLNKSMAQLETLDLNVNLAEKAYRMSREAYNAGSKELLEVEDSERNLNNAKLEVLKEKYKYNTGILDLEYALNASLKEIEESSNE